MSFVISYHKDPCRAELVASWTFVTGDAAFKAFHLYKYKEVTMCTFETRYNYLILQQFSVFSIRLSPGWNPSNCNCTLNSTLGVLAGLDRYRRDPGGGAGGRGVPGGVQGRAAGPHPAELRAGQGFLILARSGRPNWRQRVCTVRSCLIQSDWNVQLRYPVLLRAARLDVRLE